MEVQTLHFLAIFGPKFLITPLSDFRNFCIGAGPVAPMDSKNFGKFWCSSFRKWGLEYLGWSKFGFYSNAPYLIHASYRPAYTEKNIFNLGAIAPHLWKIQDLNFGIGVLCPQFIGIS